MEEELKFADISTKADDFVESAPRNPAFEESAMFENMAADEDPDVRTTIGEFLSLNGYMGRTKEVRDG